MSGQMNQRTVQQPRPPAFMYSQQESGDEYNQATTATPPQSNFYNQQTSQPQTAAMLQQQQQNRTGMGAFGKREAGSDFMGRFIDAVANIGNNRFASDLVTRKG